jgi:hypothetical protein
LIEIIKKWRLLMSQKFPEVAGKTVKNTLFTSSSYHAVAIRFEDASILNIDLEPGFHGNSRLLRLKTGEPSAIGR